MAHWRTAFDSNFLGSWDLRSDRKDTIAVIERVEFGKVENKQKKKVDRKIILHIRMQVVREDGRGIEMRRMTKPLICNKTNAKTISGLHGDETAEWNGKAFAMYATQVEAGGETVSAIRVRNYVPQRSGAAAPVAKADHAAVSSESPAPDPEPQTDEGHVQPD